MLRGGLQHCSGCSLYVLYNLPWVFEVPIRTYSFQYLFSKLKHSTRSFRGAILRYWSEYNICILKFPNQAPKLVYWFYGIISSPKSFLLLMWTQRLYAQKLTTIVMCAGDQHLSLYMCCHYCNTFWYIFRIVEIRLKHGRFDLLLPGKGT